MVTHSSTSRPVQCLWNHVLEDVYLFMRSMCHDRGHGVCPTVWSLGESVRVVAVLPDETVESAPLFKCVPNAN